MPERYVGLISGTSMDGVDAVVAEISATACTLHTARTYPYPTDLRRRISSVVARPETTLKALGHLDTALGAFFSDCALAIIAEAGLDPEDIRAIGHHGQTIHHAPEPPEAFTMQIGTPT